MNNPVFYKYLDIKQDLLNNLRDVFNRRNYYSKKYRGNLLTDINVAIDITPEGNKMIQIFVRDKGYWIRDRVEFNREGIVNNNVKHNFYD